MTRYSKQIMLTKGNLHAKGGKVTTYHRPCETLRIPSSHMLDHAMNFKSAKSLILERGLEVDDKDSGVSCSFC